MARGVVVAAALALAGCASVKSGAASAYEAALPDRIYVEASEIPWRDDYDRALTLGVSYDLGPTDVRIVGQADAHPWDFLDTEPVPPTPLVVDDSATRDAIEMLRAATEANTAVSTRVAVAIEALQADAEAAKAQFRAANALLGGGGLAGAVALFLGLRRRRGKAKPDTDE